MVLIIESKLYIPRTRSALVSRPRLIKRLDDGLKGKLALITAPAGYGKTTLASEWAAGLQTPVAWISLDAGDRDSLRFWRYTLAALKQAVPSFDEQAVLRFATGAHSREVFIAAFINQLQCLSETIVIVWDDFHQVDEPTLVQEMDYLLERLPNHVHVYILCRTMPSLSLAKMRVNNLLYELGMEDLCFSSSEIIEFFSQNQKRDLPPQEMNMVIKQTEGWAAGLRLVALYLDGQTGRVLGSLESLGKHRNIEDYFLEEVFRHQTPDIQSFLLKTSLLERMNSELCQAMTGLNHCQAYLEQLEQANCFIVPLDAQREWYRYHHLFQGFLREKKQTAQDLLPCRPGPCLFPVLS